MIGADATGRLATAQEPDSVVFVLNAAVGLFALTGEPATFAVALLAAQGAFALTGKPATAAIKLQAAMGQFLLSGFTANIEISRVQLPMATRRDFWDVDEWGKFMPGSGVRYTL